MTRAEAIVDRFDEGAKEDIHKASDFKLFFSSHVTLTIQKMYTYHCHNTKHLHVPLSQYKTCTRTTVTTQNMYT